MLYRVTEPIDNCSIISISVVSMMSADISDYLGYVQFIGALISNEDAIISYLPSAVHLLIDRQLLVYVCDGI